MVRPRRWLTRVPPGFRYALVCYLPLLWTQPGWIGADTKTYLYLDPATLLRRAPSMWDPNVGLGTVSHQTIGYLWPMGPWYWTADRLGVPDWIAQRLWWGTLLLLAGLGVRSLLRRLDWPPHAIWPAVLAYGLSPYLLTHIGRLSVVLLPWVGLPWLLSLTVASLRSRGWRHPALFALVVTTVGSVNLTALVLVAVGPALWLLHAIVVERVGLRRVATVTAQLGVLTALTSAWWLAGLSVQAGNGIDIVRYTETAEVVATASGAQEVLRGLGYWFFYGGDQLDPWVGASTPYTQSIPLLLATFALPILALLAAGTTRWRNRGFFILLLACGVVLAVGAHRWSDPPPLGHAIRSFLETERGLAFRSLPRAVPLVALGAAVLLAAGAAAAATRWPRWAAVIRVLACLLPLVALAPVWSGGTVSEALRRQEVPDYWFSAAEALDRGDDGTRVLEVPGIDFADYRWGATVDPVTPGLTERPYVAREHVPYGTPPSANLLNALDLPLQERTADATALAPVARLLRAGTILVRSDLQYERYNTARPRLVWDQIRQAEGLGEPTPFGPTVPNEPLADRTLLDETWLSREDGLEDPPAVALVPVRDAPGIVSTKPAAGAVLLSGDGAGIVDAAGAGVIDGRELIRYSASLDRAAIVAELARGATVVLTDTNRMRGERWSTIRHTRGFTEPAWYRPLRADPTDNRLPVFPGADASIATVAEHRGGITARATSYGNPIAFAGEQRATASIDGDVTTAWQTGAFSDARGSRLRIELERPLVTDRIRLVQAQDSDSNRSLTRVRLRLDGDAPIDVHLDDTSRSAVGQLVTFPSRAVTTAEIELVADTAGDRPRFGGFGAVGFAEVSLGDGDAPVVDEVIRLPRDLVEAAGAEARDSRIAVVLTRIRQDPTDVTRGDEEPAILRSLGLPTARTLSLRGSVHLSGRAPTAVLDELVGQSGHGVTATATSHLVGSPRHRPAAVIDGDPSTAWASEFGETTGAAVEVGLATARLIDHLTVSVVADGRQSVPTGLRVLLDGRPVAEVDVSIADGSAPGHTEDVRIDVPATTASRVRIEVTAARVRTSVNWNSGEPLAHPVAVAEVDLGHPAAAVAPVIDTGCRADLLTVGGTPVPVRIKGTTAAALRGDELALEGCGPVALGAGDHDLRAAEGRHTGLDLDRLVLESPGAGRRAIRELPPVRIIREDRWKIDVAVPADADSEPAWLILGQSFNSGWSATLDGASLGPPQLVDGYANGWPLPPNVDASERIVHLEFEPQQRVRAALLISAVAVLMCLGLAIRRPRLGRGLPRDDPAWSFPPPPLSPYPWARAVVLGSASALGAALVLAPPAAAAIGVLVVAASRVAALRAAAALLPATLVAMAAGYVVVWQLRYGILPGLEWPGELDRAHPIAMAAVVVAVVNLAASHLWSRRR